MSINDDEVPPPPPDEPPPGEGAAVDSTAITIEPNVGLEEMALTSQPDEDGFAFAVGDPQPRQCSLCCCDDALVPPKEPGGRPRKPKARVISCFMNMPLKCFRRNNGEDPYFVWGEYRFCFRMGNFTIIMDKVEPDGTQVNMMMVGPYWPFCLGLTTFLVFIIPLLLIIALWNVIHKALSVLLILGTIGTLISLSLVSCRDPGILRRVNQEPNESKEAREKKQHRKTWMWNDQAHTWKPTMASYDNDVNAVVRGFDHVCPFTGTAIGANNLRSFHAFTLSINILIYYTIGVRATKMHAP
mmetsp:Transcript_34795/g.92885  ORF Transcript_34795/g.92885 Transcript_34795/m.92885 type:complete len:299 (+) Transcript_34795:494-1390(+)